MQKTLIIDSPALKQGFTAAPNAVLYEARLSVQARWLYCILLSFAWQENECWPGQERIAKVAGWHINTVEKYLKELRDFGLISWKRQGLNRPNIYYIHDPSKALELKDSQASVNPESQGSVNPDSQASVILDSHARVKEEDSDEEDSVNNVVVVYNPATSKTTGIVPGKAGKEPVSPPGNSNEEQPGEQISLTEEIQKAFLEATGRSLPDKALAELASYPFEYVLSKIAMIEVGKDKANVPGWLIEACREDYQHLPGPKQKRKISTRSKPPKFDSAKDDKYRELYRLV
ncbi:MAG: helix-turn-helix domain-containing protein [Thermoanaerobacteraceae bacterium]|nr:helix-turn-helix domain-containing protein [Thermoanaerobacteraceae bacterium]